MYIISSPLPPHHQVGGGSSAHNEQFSQIASCRYIPSKLSPLVAGSPCFDSLATSRHHLSQSPLVAATTTTTTTTTATTTTGGYEARSISAVARYHNILLALNAPETSLRGDARFANYIFFNVYYICPQRVLPASFLLFFVITPVRCRTSRTRTPPPPNLSPFTATPLPKKKDDFPPFDAWLYSTESRV